MLIIYIRKTWRGIAPRKTLNLFTFTHGLRQLAAGLRPSGERAGQAAVPLAICRLLAARGIRSVEQAKRFLRPAHRPVRRLVRVRIGPLTDRRLQPGAWRELTSDELRNLEQAVAPEAASGPVPPSH